MLSSSGLSGSFVSVNGLQMYVEEHGHGDPLLLLHGGVVNSAMWERHLPDLVAHFRVITPDSRGHGHTAHPGGSITYQMMADDTAGLIGALNLGPTLICGYSDGGQIGLDLAVRHPEVVKAVVIGAATYRWSPVYYDTVQPWLGVTAPGVVDPVPFLGFVDRIRSRPEFGLADRDEAYWRAYQTWMSTAWTMPLPYSDDDLRGLGMPTLILAGDRDDWCAPLDDMLTMYRLIPGAELAVVPGAEHGFLFHRPAAFTSVVLDFLLRQHTAPAQ
jgi:pimeloyl-ACP methyl ester carboxylesterase